jgi:hypothetical protein
MQKDSIDFINEIWNDFVLFGYKVRSSGENGLEKWVELKKLYSWLDTCKCIPTRIDLNGTKIAKIIKEQIKYETYDKTHDNIRVVIKPINRVLDNTVPNQHFLIQHFRIPIMSNFDVPIIKLFQIAYNIGQMSAEPSKYTSEEMSYYKLNKLGEFETYIPQAS